MHSPSIQKLINLFAKFPTIGPRTASRFVFYLLKLQKEEAAEISQTILAVKEKVKLCSFCFNPFEGEGQLCEICADPRRDKALLCVIEKETDLLPIEKTKKYHGRYFILGGTVAMLKKEDIEKLRTKELVERIQGSLIQEIIIAVNPTTEGEATALYLERALRPLNKNYPFG